MQTTPWYTLDRQTEGWQLQLRGDWRVDNLPALEATLDTLPALSGDLLLDGHAMDGLDSTGVMLLITRLRSHGMAWDHVEKAGFSPQHLNLFALVEDRLPPLTPPVRQRTNLLDSLGRLSVRAGVEIGGRLDFLGRVAEALAELVRRPHLLRYRELFVQLEAVGLEAMFIIALMNFLIGVVFAFLLGTQIEKFGANIFVVDGVALAITRELAPLLTAVLMAGRSGAAYTAQLGTMKITQEIDAIATLGLSPLQVLVLPRLFAIVIAMPLLAFVGDVMGLFGAALVADAQLGITLQTFFERVPEVLPIGTMLFGLYKTPVFAAAIALIACHNGLAVSRDARSVGERTTSTVVQSLVAVIVIDSAFAVAYPDILM